MSKFSIAVCDFLSSRGVDIANVGFMEMPEKRERYNLSRLRGNVSLIEGNFIIKSEADKIVEDFLMMSLS